MGLRQMKRKLPFTYEEFKEIYSKVPRLCVDLIIKKEGKILLILRQKYGWEGLWHTPGGTVYYKEPILTAVKRIGKDEAGVNVSIKKFLGYAECPGEEKARGFGYTVSLIFLCEPKNDIKETETIKYFSKIPRNTIPELKLFMRNYSL